MLPCRLTVAPHLRLAHGFLLAPFLGHTQMGGVFALGPGAANVSADPLCFFDFNAADVGAVSFVNTTLYVPRLDPASIGAGNTFTNYGPVQATVPIAATVTIPVTVQTNAPVVINVTLVDLFNQTVRSWDDLVVSATSTDPRFLQGIAQATFAQGSAAFTNVRVYGIPFVNYSLSVSITSPTIALVTPAAVTESVSVAPCTFGQARSSSRSKRTARHDADLC